MPERLTGGTPTHWQHVRIGNAKRVHYCLEMYEEHYGMWAASPCGWAGVGRVTDETVTCRTCLKAKEREDANKTNRRDT